MESVSEKEFKHKYASHLKHLKLKGLQPKTIDAYARAIRRIGARFDHRIDDLSEQQLTDYFTDLLQSHSWSAVKLDLYGLKFYYTYVLRKPWVAIDLIKPPRSQRLPDILTIEEVARLFQATHTLSYRVFYFTLYSLGLRLGEGLRMQVGNIDAHRGRVHIRAAKGNKDRFVPLPTASAPLLATPPQSGAVVSQSPGWPEGGLPGRLAARSWQRADHLAQGDAAVWDSAYLFNHKALAKMFRAKMLHALSQARLSLPQRYPHQWVVDCKAVGSGEKALVYLGRYLYRGVIREQDILSCKDGEVTFRYQDSASGQFETRTVRGATFLWLVLQHILPKGFRRARNFGFLHPNSKHLIRLLHYLLKLHPVRLLALIRQRPSLTCRCCGGPMKIVRTRIASPTSATRHPPDATAAAASM